MCPPNQTEEKEPAGALFENNKKTVLIVEDDRTHRALMEKILGECGLKTITAENGHVALSKIDAGNKFDLIIMDLDMPAMNGLQTARKIRALEATGIIPYIPVIAFTSHCNIGDKEQCIAAGMDAYLPKDVWIPKWRTTLVDNLQGFISGTFDKSSFDNMGIAETGTYSSDSSKEGDVSGFDSELFTHAVHLLKDELEITIHEYLEDASAYIEEIKKGTAEGDFEKIARASHPLKSNSHSFGLLSVSGLARQINELAGSDQSDDKTPEKIRVLIKCLERSYQEAHKFLEEELQKTEE